jgi:hypothetical protein
MKPPLVLCRCRNTKPGEPPRERCRVVLAWMDGKPHETPRCRCKLGLPYVPETGEENWK